MKEMKIIKSKLCVSLQRVSVFLDIEYISIPNK